MIENLVQDHHSELTVDENTLTNDTSRRAFLTKLAAGAAAATTLAAAPATVFGASGAFKHVGAGIPASDAAILNFALTLEHLEATFYERASAKVGGSAYVKRLIRVLRFDEQQHVAGLTAALSGAGYKPVAAAPRYNFGGAFKSTKSFLTTSAALEDTGVHAYLGQAGNFKTPALLLTAASILTVEARHTGAIRAMLKNDPTDGPFDHGSTKQQILAIAGPFIGH